MEYNEKRRDSGSSFITFLRKNYLDGELPLVNFIPKSLKTVMATLDFSKKPLLLLVLKPDHPSVEQTVRALVTDPEFSGLANANFHPTGILTTSSEIRTVQGFSAQSTYPCLLVVRLLTAGAKKEIKVDCLVLLHNPLDDRAAVAADKVTGEIKGYLGLETDKERKLRAERE